MYLKSKNQRRSDGQKDLHGFRKDLEMIKFIYALLICAALPVFVEAEEVFAANVTKNNAELQSGGLKFKMGGATANFSVSLPSGDEAFNLYMGDKYCPMEEFKLVLDEPDRKILVWVGAPVVTGGSLAQFTCEYEIRRGLPAVFVRCRLYNRDEAGPASCYFLWAFQMKSPTLESAGGTVHLGGQDIKLLNTKDWLFSAAPEAQGGLGIVTDGLDIIQRKVFSSWTQQKWDDVEQRGKSSWVKWHLAVNHGADGLNGSTGLKPWTFDKDDYSSMNFVVFPAKSKEDCAAMFKKLSEAELAGRWKYSGEKGK